MSLPWMFQYNMFVLLVWAGIIVLLGIVRVITDAVSMGKRAITDAVSKGGSMVRTKQVASAKLLAERWWNV